VLGTEVGTLLAERYRAHGIDLRLGAGVTGFSAGEDGHVRAVRLDDGSEVACDVALVGIGAEPAGELLGVGEIATDASGRTALPDVYACGDVASTWRASLGRRVRVEHWTNAAGQAAAVARTILGEESVHDDVPFFWSDQFGLRLQHVGFASEWARVEIGGGTNAFSARYLDHDGRLLAALGANRPGEIAALRRELKANARASVERRRAPELRPALSLP
jgi:3-phenylpropionate/trans-cinnamate dioxygenase ferredoxin reductase subunit